MNAPQNAQVLFSIANTAVTTASADGTGCDMIDANSVLAVFKYGASVTTNTPTNGISALKVQHSDDNSTFTDIIDIMTATAAANGAAAGVAASTDDAKFYTVAIDKRSRKRYLRWSYTITGTGSLNIETAFFVGMDNATVPADQTNSLRLAAYTA